MAAGTPARELRFRKHERSLEHPCYTAGRAMLLRRPLPRLAQVSLVLGACGDSGTDPGDVTNVFEATCRRLERCEPDEFVAEYADFETCVQSQANYFASFEYEFGSECLEAYTARASCFFDATGGACAFDMAAEARACAEELEALDAACAFAY